MQMPTSEPLVANTPRRGICAAVLQSNRRLLSVVGLVCVCRCNAAGGFRQMLQSAPKFKKPYSNSSVPGAPPNQCASQDSEISMLYASLLYCKLV